MTTTSPGGCLLPIPALRSGPCISIVTLKLVVSCPVVCPSPFSPASNYGCFMPSSMPTIFPSLPVGLIRVL